METKKSRPAHLPSSRPSLHPSVLIGRSGECACQSFDYIKGLFSTAWQAQPAPGQRRSGVADLAKTGTGTDEWASASAHTSCSGSSPPAEALVETEGGVLVCSSSRLRLSNTESERVYRGVASTPPVMAHHISNLEVLPPLNGLGKSSCAFLS